MVGQLKLCPKKDANFAPKLAESLKVLDKYRKDLHDFCETKQSAEAIDQATNRLFRPLILDGLVMMQLVKNENLCQVLKEIQTAYLAAWRKKRALKLTYELPMEFIDIAVDKYAAAIQNQI